MTNPRITKTASLGPLKVKVFCGCPTTYVVSILSKNLVSTEKSEALDLLSEIIEAAHTIAKQLEEELP